MDPWWPLIAGCTAAIAVGIASCGSAKAPEPNHTTIPPAINGAAPQPVTQTCQSEFQAWKASGLPLLVKVASDLNSFSNDATAQNLGAVQADATQSTSDANAVLVNLPPSCVPGMADDVTTAMNDLVSADDSVNQGSIAGLESAVIQMQAVTAAINRATTDLTSWQSAGMPG